MNIRNLGSGALNGKMILVGIIEIIKFMLIFRYFDIDPSMARNIRKHPLNFLNKPRSSILQTKYTWSEIYSEEES